MKIVILGATGFIGEYLADNLSIIEQYTIYEISRYLTSKSLLNISISKKTNGSKIIKNEINELFDSLKNIEPDIIINCISYGVNYIDNDETKAFETNSTLPVNLYSLCKDLNIKKFIHLGSSEEYGLMDGLINENYICDPVSLYGRSKRDGTKKLLNISRNEKRRDLLILRLFSIYGPRENLLKLIPMTISNILNNTEIKLTEGKQLKNYLYVADLVNIIKKILINIDKFNDDVYQIASSKNISVYEILKLIGEISNSHSSLFKWGELKYRKSESFNYYVDTSRLQSIIGKLEEKVDIRDGIKKVYDSMK